MTTTKSVNTLAVGDRVRLKEPDGIAAVRRIERTRIFQASGGCFMIDLAVVDGPHKGEKIKNQLHAGDTIVELA